ncbi:MAG: ATP-binding cassette domain-containing protein [Pirellulales bacterium]
MKDSPVSMAEANHSAAYRLQNVERRRGDAFRLLIDDLVIEPGEVLCLVGPTGAGKSTLLSLLSGLAPIDGGQLWFGGHPLHERPLPLAKLRTIAAVTQRPLPMLGSTRRNVECGLRWRGVSDRNERIDGVLARLRLAEIASQSASRLSGGQLQLVALARALVLRPDVLLLDEPTAALDPARVALVESLLADERSARPTTIVWATHHLYQARRVADRVVLLLDGRVIETEATERFFDTPSDPRTAAFVRGEMIY